MEQLNTLQAGVFIWPFRKSESLAPIATVVISFGKLVLTPINLDLIRTYHFTHFLHRCQRSSYWVTEFDQKSSFNGKEKLLRNFIEDVKAISQATDEIKEVVL